MQPNQVWDRELHISLSMYSEGLVPLALLRDWLRMDWGYMYSYLMPKVPIKCGLLMCGPKRVTHIHNIYMDCVDWFLWMV